MNSYTLLWTNQTWDTKSQEKNGLISYVGGKEEHPLKGIKAGDEIFVVKVKANRLFVGGRMIAQGSPVGIVEAQRLLPGVALIDKNIYVVAQPDFLDKFRPNVSLGEEEVRSLEVIIQGEVQHKTFTATTFQQDFRNTQRISEASAQVFRKLLSISPTSTASDASALDVALVDAENQDNLEDQRALRSIKSRRGQPEFRSKLLAAYEGKCCFTGCDVIEILEAAHIRSHSEETDYSHSNGLLLRADIHTLFDLNMIAVDELRRIKVSPNLKGSEYWRLDGQPIRLPAKLSESPSFHALGFRAKQLIGSSLRR